MAKIIVERFKVTGYYNIQVDYRLFQLRYGNSDDMFACYGLQNNWAYRRYMCDQLIKGRYDFCVVNYKNSHLIQSGGCNENQNEIYQRVDYYDVVEDVWK